VLFELFCNNPTFLRTYLELISDHAFILGDKIKHYINKTIRESIMNYLNYESKKQNSNCIKLNITKKGHRWKNRGSTYLFISRVSKNEKRWADSIWLRHDYAIEI